MKASECTFEEMMVSASQSPILGTAASFVQVEFGLDELKTCWAGFADSSDSFGVKFTSKKHILHEFAIALSEYIEYLNEPSSIEVGS